MTSKSNIHLKGDIKLVHTLFENQVIHHPDLVAVIDGNESVTYSELNKRANRISRLLVQSNNVGQLVVGICLPRSTDLIASILAVLKSGGAYVPLDPQYPVDRLKIMVQQLPRMDYLITNLDFGSFITVSKAKKILLNCEESTLEELDKSNLNLPVHPTDLCYIVFTSGSTGVPKATAVTHEGWSNLILWFVESMRLNKSDKNFLVSPFGFDITQRSIASTLITGASLILYPNGPFDPLLCNDIIADDKITLIHCAPSVLYSVIDISRDSDFESLKGLRYAFIGGEALSGPRISPWVTSKNFESKIVNVYGVAECSDVSSYYIVNKADDPYLGMNIPIGKAISNTTVTLFNDNSIIPFVSKESEVGEILIGGIGVGSGYVNSSVLTREKFVMIPSISRNRKVYRTGDLGKYLKDGNLQYLGRKDSQVKIRGMRVELGDVEASIRRIGIAKDVAVTLVNSDGNILFVAFLLVDKSDTSTFRIDAKEDRKSAVELRKKISNVLPSHMVPDKIVLVDSFPLNPNGKLDRKRLFKNLNKA